MNPATRTPLRCGMMAIRVTGTLTATASVTRGGATADYRAAPIRLIALVMPADPTGLTAEAAPGGDTPPWSRPSTRPTRVR